MSNLKYKLEALLFSSARSMKIEELSNLTKASPEEIREKLNEIKKEYEERDSSITLIDEGASFKLNVKSEHASVIQQIVTETELSKTLMETLAVIAFKYPMKQSDLIKIRTNKSYDHLRELEEMGYITRQKYGRTKLIKLTPKFFEYFDLPPERLKEKFQDFAGIAQAIKEKEEEIKGIKAEMKRKAKEAGKEGKKEAEIDLVDKEGHKQKLETYEKAETEPEEGEKVQPYSEKLGNLEVTDVPLKEQESEEELEEQEPISEEPEVGDEIKDMIEPGEESEGTSNTSKEVEIEVDKKVEELLHPETEDTPEPIEEILEEAAEEKPIETPETEKPSEEESEEEPEEEPSEEEPEDLLEALAEEEKKKDENIPS